MCAAEAAGRGAMRNNVLGLSLAAWAVCGVWARGDFRFERVACDTNAWQTLGASSALAPDGALSVRHCDENGRTGVLLPRVARCRQNALAEADVAVSERLGSNGWNVAGLTLYQDDANYWMLALVEGPDGRHTIGFLENRAGVWQAQGEPATVLAREGNVSFDWKSGTRYRLRLALADGRVLAQVGEADGGRALSAASYVLGEVPAVRMGTPGVIVRDAAATVSNFRFGLMASASETNGAPSVALLDDALPGQDRAANARLAAALEARGFAVTRLTVDQALVPRVLTADVYQALIVPQCDAVPVALGAAAQRFSREGGHLVFLGGPFLDRALVKAGGKWLDRAGQERLLLSTSTAHRAFEIQSGGDFTAWGRSTSSRDSASSLAVVGEGPDGAACLRLSVPDLQGWDVFQSPKLSALFGEGDDLFTFMAKGGAKTGQLAVEVIERDGSRWIATAPVTTEWRRVSLRVGDFHYWRDSSTKRRGHAGDRLRPADTVRLCLGFSGSHTPAIGGGSHTVWLADVGSARDPLAASGAAESFSGSIECVYPRYKVYTLPRGGATVSCPTVCAIPRPLGEGFGRGAKWRFVPLAEAADGAARGVCEWLLLNTRFPLEGAAVAGFGYTDPAVWSSDAVAGRIAAALRRLTSGVLFEEFGTDQFAYWKGETARVGVRLRLFGATEKECRLSYSVHRLSDPKETEPNERNKVGGGEVTVPPQAPGVVDLVMGSFAAAEPGEYVVVCRGGAEGGKPWTVDEARHRFSVLDPSPAPKAAFIAARDGDFWLEGRKWYPVGVNFWPLYVSGMEAGDYGGGWLKDAYYAPGLVERDLAQMKAMGISMVSIQTPPLASHRNLLDFLARCRAYDIHANLYVGAASPVAFDDEGLKVYLETARLPDNPTVFAYDTIWEPGNHLFKDDAARGRWDGDWRAWIEERYGSVERAEKDWGCPVRRDKQGKPVSPPNVDFREDGEWRVMMAAYRRFMDNLTSRLWGRANRRLRELDPNHLVSFRQGNTLPHDFALSGPVRHIDFICPEGYSIHDTDEGEDAIGFITRYVDFTTHGKPVVWSEFGQSVWDAARMAPDAGAVERQGRYSARFYRAGLAAGAVGTVPWWWVGGYRVNENSDYGIIAPDGTERPAAKLIREYGPRFQTPREKPQPQAWFEFDRDAHAGGYWRAAFNEGAAAYRAAAKAGQMLGVRTAGSGTDSACLPLVAVGNVPCDGTNPPKYLDAEFNALQVRDADGAWREASAGAVIEVKAGQPVRVRASVGNTQEAAWLPENVSLAVRRRGDRENVLARPLAARVEYLGDAAFGEFDLPIEAFGELSMRMELEREGTPLIPFGEARVFALRARR